MTNKKNAGMRKVAGLLVMLLIITTLLFTLSSCGGNDKIADKNAAETNHAFAARVLKTNDTWRLNFIAASRGYDITPNDFKEESITDRSDKNPLKELARKILTDATNKNRFQNGSDKQMLLDFASQLEDTDIKLIAEALKVSYDLEVENGLFDFILIGVGAILGWMTTLFGQQYIIAILVLALIVEILMLPIAIKQQKNSIGMAKIRPKLMAIEEKYAGRKDQVTLRKKQEEMMELQRKEGYSPFSGCLPMLLQLIVVGFIIYPIVVNPLRYMLGQSADFSQALISYVTSSKALGGLGLTLSSNNNVIEILSILKENGQIEGIKSFALIANGEACYNAFNSITMPSFSLLGLNLGRVPKIWDILVLVPILNGVVTWLTFFLSQKWNVNNGMTAAPADGNNAQSKMSMNFMNLIMPLMTILFTFFVPALVGIYWLFRSLISLLKQYIIKTAMPVPQYTEEELKAMRKAEKKAQKQQRAALKEAPKYKSLHYIDDDDYDELPELKPSNPKKPNGGNGGNSGNGGGRPEIKD